jgi:hypothetical protein
MVNEMGSNDLSYWHKAYIAATAASVAYGSRATSYP